ncbi:putative disease resistance protein RGA3 [Olea europaea var. sylvestris]|uniref:putative disease resistance protein RGA3 n=1 Tax=Olea europaea var. sylvestris TaxID=158386 RepID=UPI000C1CDE9E|nr:putative disease resistance protein RGA3 [Olea europaea var. sylvestris]
MTKTGSYLSPFPRGGTTSVISIVGTPGIGKTTLSQFIYNDDKVKKHFDDLRIWVFVSRDFNAKRIIKEIIEKSIGNKCDLMDLGAKYLSQPAVKKAALVVGNSDTAYRLKGLSNDDCWKIFTKRASFTRTEEEKYLNLIGKELMRKCGGVPLATKILGGLMRFKREEREWLYEQNRLVIFGLWGFTKIKFYLSYW